MSLICRDISYAYNGADVLHEVGLTVSQGTFCALLGRNGSGKTTLLHCICGILRPLRGEIVVNGRPVPVKNGAQRARCLSLVPQEPGHVFPFTVLDLVLMGRNPYLPAGAQPGPEDKRIAWQALEILHAEYLASRRVNQISSLPAMWTRCSKPVRCSSVWPGPWPNRLRLCSWTRQAITLIFTTSTGCCIRFEICAEPRI